MLQTLRNTDKHYATLANTTQHWQTLRNTGKHYATLYTVPQSLKDATMSSPTFKVETLPIENVLLLQSLVGNSFIDFCFWFSLLFWRSIHFTFLIFIFWSDSKTSVIFKICIYGFLSYFKICLFLVHNSIVLPSFTFCQALMRCRLSKSSGLLQAS